MTQLSLIQISEMSNRARVALRTLIEELSYLDTDSLIAAIWRILKREHEEGVALRFTPSEVEDLAIRYGYRWPLTSIRRALTNLTKAGHLIHYPADRRQGPRGAKESTWGLKD